MSLINCKECNKEIAKDSKQCPQCGSSKHRSFFSKHPIVSTIASIFVIGILVSMCSESQFKEIEQTPKDLNSIESKTEIIKKPKQSLVEINNTINNFFDIKNPPDLPKESNWNYELGNEKFKHAIANLKSTNTIQIVVDSEYLPEHLKSTNYTNLNITLGSVDPKSSTVELSIDRGRLVCWDEKTNCKISLITDKEEEFDVMPGENFQKILVLQSEKFINLIKEKESFKIKVKFTYQRMKGLGYGDDAIFDFKSIGLMWK